MLLALFLSFYLYRFIKRKTRISPQMQPYLIIPILTNVCNDAALTHGWITRIDIGCNTKVFSFSFFDGCVSNR